MSSDCRAAKDKLDARHGTAARFSVKRMKCHLQCITYKRRQSTNRRHTDKIRTGAALVSEGSEVKLQLYYQV